MQKAYTLIASDGRHWDVGPTYQDEEKAQSEKQDYHYNQIQPVTCWIDDFDRVEWGVFLFRTDCIHEVSFVVTEESTDSIDKPYEALVETKIGGFDSQ